MGRSSPLARPVDLDPDRNATERAGRRPIPSRRTRRPLARLPDGPQVFHGLPFDLGPGSPGRRWILVDAPVTIELPGGEAASHLVVAHLCDTWRDDAGGRPEGLAVGHVVPAGEPLARYTVVDRSGRTDEPRHPPPVRDRRRDPRLGDGRLRGDPASRQRGRRLARSASVPGARSLRRGRPVRDADDHARDVHDEPDGRVRLRPERDGRRASCGSTRSSWRPAPSRSHCVSSRSREAGRGAT